MRRDLLAVSLITVGSMLPCMGTFRASATGSGDVAPVVWGCVLDSDAWDFPQSGMYAFNTADAQMSTLTESWSMIANAGGFFADGTFYSINSDKMWGMTFTRLSKFDVEIWEEDYNNSKGSDNMVMAATALAYDSTDKIVYGCYHNYDEDGYELGVGDYLTFTRTTLCALDEPLIAMAASPEGIIYGIKASGELFTMNKESGELIRVGTTGLTLEEKNQGCVYDPASSSLILAAVLADNTTALYQINPADTKASMLVDLPDNQYISVLSLPIEPVAGAPAQVDGIKIDFPKGSLTGTISFTIPEKTYSGEQLTGEVNYKLFINGEEVEEGAANPGETVSKEMTLEEGRTKVTVSLENIEGQGKKLTINTYIGFAYPGYPSGIKFEFDDKTGEVKLSWNRCTYAIDEGYFSESDITYNVVRQPDGKIIAEGLRDPECTDVLPLDAWTGYRYAISTVNGTKSTEPTFSQFIPYGAPVELPYSNDFSTEEEYGAFFQYHNPEVEKSGSWMYSDYRGGAIFYPGDKDSDDWLIAPPMEMKAGFVYLLTFRCKADYVYNGSKECLEVAYGIGDNPVTYDVLMEPTDVDWTDFREFKMTVTPAEDGVYRVGFHVLSKANMRGLCLGGMSVEYGVAPGAPAAVSDLIVVPGEKGTLSASLDFILPEKTINGETLTSVTSVEAYRDGKLCASVADNLKPGEKLTLKDELGDLTTGTHTYSVMVYNGDGCGAAAVAEAYIGLDAPAGVRNLRFEDNFDGTAWLKWDAPGTVGLNGGYCPEEGFSYAILVENEFGQLMEKVDFTSNELLVTDITQTGKQRLISGAVTATNAYGESEPAIIYAPLYGAPYTLPFEELLTEGFTTYDCWRSTAMNGDQFGVMIVVGASDLMVDESYFRYDGKKAGDYSILSSGKISLAGAEKPELSFDLLEYPGAAVSVEVFVDCATEKNAQVALIDYKALPGSVSEWKKHTFDLSAYTEYPYITLNFKGTMFELGSPIGIRHIAVTDMAYSTVKKLESVSDITVSVENGCIIVEGAEGMEISLHTVSGMTILHKVASEEERIEVASGYYVLKVGPNAYKLVVR